MKEETLDCKVFYTHPHGCKIRPAEKTLRGHGNSGGIKWCMPYKIVNSTGFWVYTPVDMEITWHGGSDFTYKIFDKYSDEDYFKIGNLLRAKDLKDFERWSNFGVGRTKFTFGSVDVGVVQIYTGCIFKTSPNWCLQIRSPVNFPVRQQVSVMEAILETDWLQYDIWINLVFHQTKKPLLLKKDDSIPIAHLVPVHRQTFTSEWNLEFHEMNNLTDESSDVLDFYVNYNKRKFASCGKNNINDLATKDSATYVKVKKENLNKDGSCSGRKISKTRSKKVFFNKKS
jgi:hypothetical protein